MSMVSKLALNANLLINSLSSRMKKHFPDYSILETSLLNEPTILCSDGSLLTVFEINGTKTAVPGQTFSALISKFTNQIREKFKEPGLILQVAFSFDPTSKVINAHLNKMMSGGYNTATKFNYLDSAFSLLDSQKETLQDIVAIERNYLLIWTTSASLSKHELKEKAERYKENLKNMPPLGNGANPFLLDKLILENHKKNCESIASNLSQQGIILSRLTINEIIHEMRIGLLVNPERDLNVINYNNNIFNTQKYENDSPVRVHSVPIVEKTINAHIKEIDASIPKINEFAKIDVENAGNPNQVLIDQVYFQPMVIERPPSEIRLFNELFANLAINAKIKDKRIPYRIMFTLSSGGYKNIEFKYNLASLLQSTNYSTKNLYDASKTLKDFYKTRGTIVGFTMHMVTWGKTSEEASERSNLLSTYLESWGSTKIGFKTGNPIAALASSSMGFSHTGIAPKAIAPLNHALHFLPFARPTSLWKEGALIFRSFDGKPMPYQSMSSIFNAWITFIAAGTGAGKSVLGNHLNTMFFLDGDLTQLPYVSIIDFGFSSRGFIQILQRLLPPNHAHLAVHKVIQENEEFCVNPHQLGLGLRFPKSEELDFLISLYCQAVVERETGKELPDAYNFFSFLIQEAYIKYSDCRETFSHAQPKPYIKGEIPQIDKILQEASDLNHFQIIDSLFLKESNIYKYSEQNSNSDKNAQYQQTTWWEVCDFLCTYKNPKTGEDYIKEANLAMRKTAFVTGDLIELIASSANIQQKYTGVTIDGRNFLDIVRERLISFQNNFKILSGETRFDIENAHAISLDIEKIIVVNPKNQSDFYKNSLIYMYTMRTLTKRFFYTSDELSTNFPLPNKIRPPATMNIEFLKKYHSKEVEKLQYAKKRIMIDEFHYTGSSYNMMKMLDGLMRVVRKRNMEIICISQKLEDFIYKSAEKEINLLSSASIIFILSAIKDVKQLNFIEQQLNITDQGTLEALKNNILSPKENPTTGGTFMAFFKTGSQIYSQILTNKLSNYCLWQYSTDTNNELPLKEEMIKLCNNNENLAVTILAKTIAPHNTKMRVSIINNELHAQDDFTTSPIKKLALILKKEYETLQLFHTALQK